jgi:hypothetical protein
LLPDEINEVIGTITQNPDDPNKLDYVIDIDSIPANDLTAINAVIDPLRSGPGTGLPAASLGQRYLLINAIGDEDNDDSFPNYSEAWEGATGDQLVALTDDIIEYDGTNWVVSFDAIASVDETHYVTNLTTEIQYTWALTKWIKSYEGEYKAGYWQIIF